MVAFEPHLAEIGYPNPTTRCGTERYSNAARNVKVGRYGLRLTEGRRKILARFRPQSPIENAARRIPRFLVSSIHITRVSPRNQVSFPPTRSSDPARHYYKRLLAPLCCPSFLSGSITTESATAAPPVRFQAWSRRPIPTTHLLLNRLLLRCR